MQSVLRVARLPGPEGVQLHLQGQGHRSGTREELQVQRVQVLQEGKLEKQI